MLFITNSISFSSSELFITSHYTLSTAYFPIALSPSFIPFPHLSSFFFLFDTFSIHSNTFSTPYLTFPLHFLTLSLNFLIFLFILFWFSYWTLFSHSLQYPFLSRPIHPFPLSLLISRQSHGPSPPSLSLHQSPFLPPPPPSSPSLPLPYPLSPSPHKSCLFTLASRPDVSPLTVSLHRFSF